MVSFPAHTVEKRTLLILLVVGLATVLGLSQPGDILDAGNPSGDLVADYRLDDGGGQTATDATDNDYDATLNHFDFNATSGWTDGNIGGALRFDGKNDSVTATNLDLSSVRENESFAVSGWFKTSSGGDGMLFGMTRNAFTGGTDSNAYLMKEGGNYIAWEVEPGYTQGGNYIAQTDRAYNDGNWHHIYAEREQHTWKIYVDGKLRATTYNDSLNEGLRTDANFDMGAYRDRNNYFDGEISQARMWTTNLSDSEIKSLYNRGGTRIGTEPAPPQGTVLDIGMTKKNSTHVFDTSGNSNHGKPQNGASQKKANYCQVGRCYEFDGDNDMINTSFTGTGPTDALTVMAWVNVLDNNSRPGHYQDLVAKEYAAQWALLANENKHKFRWHINTTGSESYEFRNIYEYQVKQPYHLAMTYDSSTGAWKQYVNGREVNRETLAGTINSGTNPVQIGAGPRDNNYARARIDQVKIFDRALGRQEIVDEAERLESTGAVLDMPFNAGGGPTVYDHSLHENNGSLQPSEANGPQRVAGMTGRALSFDGSNDEVSIPHDSSLNSQQLTVAAWVKPDTLGNNYRTILHKGYDESILKNRNWEYNLRVESDNDLQWSINTTSGWRNARWDNDGGWTGDYSFVVGRANSTHISVWFNGEQKALQPVSTDINTTTYDAKIGNPGDDNDVWNGDIDNVKIYPYALSEDKISQLYSQGSTRIGKQGDKAKQPQAPGTDQLVGEWGFENGNSSWTFDTSGEVNHGQLNGPTERSSNHCKKGKCYRFDGSSDHIDLGNPESLDFSGRSEITLETWVRWDGSDAGEWRDMVNLEDEAQLGMTDGDNWFFRIYDSTGSPHRESFDASSDAGDWVHLAGKYNGSILKLYVNGEQQGSESFSDTIHDSGDTQSALGGDLVAGNYYFPGDIDQVSIYNRTLSDTEVWHLYSQGRDRHGNKRAAGPTAWWRMTERGYLYDRSGEENHGTSHVVGETGTFNTSNGKWQDIDFAQHYKDPVVVGTTNTQNNEVGLIFEARKVNNGSAEMRLCESEGGSSVGCDQHISERGGYVVIDAEGANKASGLEAGTFSLGGEIDSNTETVTFSESFSSRPVVFFSTMNDSGKRPVEVWPTSVDNSSFTAGICKQDSTDGCNTSQPAQKVGWIAIEPGNEPFAEQAEADNLSNAVGASTWVQNAFSQQFTERPVALFEVQDNNGGEDPKIDEIRNVNTTHMEMRFCELESGDGCDGHIEMEYGWAAFDEGILTVDTSNGNWPQWKQDCTVQGCYEFDGNDDMIEGDASGLPSGSDSFTASIWFKTDTSHSSDALIWGSLNSREATGLRPEGSDLVFTLYGNHDLKVVPPYPYADGTWHHLAGVYNDSAANEMKLYYDGTLIGSQSETMSISENKFSIGAKFDNSQYFEGHLDDIRIYPYPMTAEQIQEVTNQGAASFGG